MTRFAPPAELGRATWPIAPAMINFAGPLPDGTPVEEASAEQWAEALGQLVDEGFDLVDPTDSWLRLADLAPSRQEEFLAVADGLGLGIPAISTARRSPIDPEHGDENLAYLHRVIDTAAAIGAPDVSVGLFRALLPAQREALWFWTAPGAVDDSEDRDAWRLAVARLRELGDHGASVGVHVSLEMYEDTYLGTADSAVRLVTEIGSEHVHLNPDLGNLIRLHRPVEHWRAMAEKVLPHTRYWHVKNYARTEDAGTGLVVTAPAPLESGVIDYRWAVRFAIEHGFRGTLCVEHYGGDGLSVSARNRDYLRRVLPARVG